MDGIKKWIEQLKKCVAVNGDLCWKMSVQCVREINFFHSDVTFIILYCHKLFLYNWRPYLSTTPRIWCGHTCLFLCHILCKKCSTCLIFGIEVVLYFLKSVPAVLYGSCTNSEEMLNMWWEIKTLVPNLTSGIPFAHCGWTSWTSAIAGGQLWLFLCSPRLVLVFCSSHQAFNSSAKGSWMKLCCSIVQVFSRTSWVWCGVIRPSKESIQLLFLYPYMVKHPLFVTHYMVFPYIMSSFSYPKSIFPTLNLHYKFLSACSNWVATSRNINLDWTVFGCGVAQTI
jgi:hypothetical protein